MPYVSVVTPRVNHTKMRGIHRLYKYGTVQLKIELIGKIHLFFDSLSLKNSIVKCVWLEAIMGWVTFWKFLKKHVSEDKIR